MAEWRTGRKVGRTIYRDGVLVGVMDTPELAAEVVAALGALGRLLGPPPTDKHCGHWQEGDGPCCGCGRPNWCPDEGATPEALEERYRGVREGCRADDSG